MAAKVCQESFVCKPDTSYPLHICAKRYSVQTPGCYSKNIHAYGNSQPITLVFLHSTSFHKETWDPTILGIFELLMLGVGGTRINTVLPVDAWAIDCPNHGQSAVLNQVALQRPEFLGQFSCEKYARAVRRFLTSEELTYHGIDGLGGKTKVVENDFRSRSRILVGIGHSLGGIALSFVQNLEPSLRFKYLVLVEPLISPRGASYFHDLRERLIRGAYERRDIWPSREAALIHFEKNAAGREWDKRVRECYVKYALYSPVTLQLEGQGLTSDSTIVTLCCTREEEATMYRDADGATEFIPDLNDACAKMPVHIIFGQRNDFMTKEIQDAIISPDSPRRFASVTRIENAGHLVPQQAPDALAKVIFEIMKDEELVSKRGYGKL